MKQTEQVRLIEQTLARLDARAADMADRTHRQPVAAYTRARRLERERTALFRALPQVVGFASQVARPGDFLTHAHTGVPILVARGEDGALGAFINACRHRGTRLLDAPCGEGMRRIVCPYHSWVYAADGTLLTVTHETGFPDLDKSERGLVRLPLAERHGLVFVRPMPGEPLDIDAWLGPLMTDLESFGFGRHVAYRPEVRERPINWKLMIDTSYESYHFKTVHRESIYPMFLDNTGVFDWSEPHARMVLPKRTIRSLADADPATWRIREHANLIYGIFPSTLFLVMDDHAMVVSAFPLAVDRTVLVSAMLIPEDPAGDPKATAHWDRNHDIFWNAIDEDIAMAEAMQATLGSGANEELLLGRFEHLIAKFHGVVERLAAE